VRIGGRWVATLGLLDSGAEVNLIHPRVLRPEDLSRLEGHAAVSSLFNGSTEALGSCEVIVRVKDIFGAVSRLRTGFVVADIGELDVILGFPWLEEADPIVSWKRRAFAFPMTPSAVRFCVSKQEIQRAAREARIAMAVIAYPVVSGPGNDVEGTGEDAVKTVPQKHSLYAQVFSPEKARALAPINKHAHAIELESDAVPQHSPIYPLAEPELEVLREYLDDALAKGWIRPSRSPAGAPILFVPKKGGQLRLCVDYRALNRITRKNRAPIPLISEILDRLSKAKVYTKLDLRDAYHRIRIKPGDE
jgi:hypothetical protein